jgi:hypothetical protein
MDNFTWTSYLSRILPVPLTYCSKYLNNVQPQPNRMIQLMHLPLPLTYCQGAETSLTAGSEGDINHGSRPPVSFPHASCIGLPYAVTACMAHAHDGLLNWILPDQVPPPRVVRGRTVLPVPQEWRRQLGAGYDRSIAATRRGLRPWSRR